MKPALNKQTVQDFWETVEEILDTRKLKIFKCIGVVVVFFHKLFSFRDTVHTEVLMGEIICESFASK